MGTKTTFASQKALQKAVGAGVTCQCCGARMVVCDRGGGHPSLRYTLTCPNCKRWFDAGSKTVVVNKEKVEVPPFGRM